ncbi:hypothetical protein Tco_1524008 [Tanacetum coccineum]
MENANPPPTSNRPILPAVLCVQAVQELHERQRISAFIDSRLESSERFLTNFANQPNETNMNDPESNDESVDTLLVSPFPHSDNDSDEGEVLNELIEYENVGIVASSLATGLNVSSRIHHQMRGSYYSFPLLNSSTPGKD